MSAACALWLVLNRNRVELSVQLLTTITELMHTFPGLVTLAYAATALQFLWLLIWSAAFSYAMQGGAPPAAIFLLCLSLFWTSQLLRSVMHTTVAGTIGAWYFLSPNLPTTPTHDALVRALTTSFGSLCLGSLVSAPLQVLRALAQRGASGQISVPGLKSASLCLLGFVDVIVRFFNDFAYSQVALYGKNFTRASWDTWTLLVRHSGVDALMQRDLVGSALALAAVLSGLCTSLIASTWACSVFGSSSTLWWQTYIMSFAMGYVAVAAASSAVDAGVVALYVCYAEDPNPLASLAPSLYGAFIAHPHVPGYAEHFSTDSSGTSCKVGGVEHEAPVSRQPPKQPYTPMRPAPSDEDV